MFLDSLIERRQSPENPSTSLSNPASWLYTALGAGEGVWSGARVSETTALNFSAYYACVRVLAETIATVPLKVYERKGGNAREEARNHPIWRLLHSRPNPEMSSFLFRELLQAHLVTWGNAYAEIERNHGEDIVALWPISPDRVRVEREGGAKYLIVAVNGQEIPLWPGKFIHIPGLGFDGTIGYSPVRLAKQAIGMGMAAEEYGARWFGSGGKPPIVIKHPAQLSKEAAARLRDKFGEVHGSLSKSQRTMVLDEGMDVEMIGIPNDDAQFLETRKFQVEEMARIHRIPPHKIQHLERSTFSNIEHQSIEFVQDAAMPWATRWEQILTYELFSEAEQGRYFVEFNLDGLLRGDTKSRAESLAIQRQWGIINADEWRAKENMNPQEDGNGEIYLVPMNMVPSDQAGELPSIEDPPERGAREKRSQRSAASRHRQALAYIRIFERAASHFVNREMRAALRILKRAFETDAPIETFLKELRAFYETFPEAIQREFLPVVLSFAEVMRMEIIDEVGSDPNQILEIDQMARAYTDVFTKRYVGSSIGQVEKLIGETEASLIEQTLEQRFIEWGEGRAAKVGMNESIRAAGALSKAAYLAIGVRLLRWVAIGDNCPLCSEMNNRVVGREEFFLNRGDTVEPGVEGVQPLEAKRPISHPPLHRGCDCMIVAG